MLCCCRDLFIMILMVTLTKSFLNCIIRDNCYSTSKLFKTYPFAITEKTSPCRVIWPHPPARSAVLPRSQVHVLLKRFWRCTQARNNWTDRMPKVTWQITINVIINKLFSEQFHQCAVNMCMHRLVWLHLKECKHTSVFTLYSWT